MSGPRPLALLAALASVAGCTPTDLPTHTLAFGGDVFLGRQLNQDLWQDPETAMDGLAPVLAAADLAVVNAEGVIAAGGAFADKGEPRPYTFRAIPAATDMLTAAGVDVLLMGNNHSGDYGPEALLEMRDRVLMAGMDYAGAGEDAADARRPAYRRVDDTVVALVGVDLTGTLPYRARAHRPGTLAFSVQEPEDRDRAVEALGRILDEAREHAHVVLLAPHWGRAFQTEPDDDLQALARQLIERGYDGILGHGSHYLQGADLVDGKPVIYDAGNLRPDYSGEGPHHQGMLYELEFTRAGVQTVRAHPVYAAGQDTIPAVGRDTEEILMAWQARTVLLGTSASFDEAVGLIRCEPGRVRGPRGTPEPPARSVPEQLREAPQHRVLAEVPPTAKAAAVRFSNGVELLGYELLLDRLRRPKAGQVVTLYLSADGPVSGGPDVVLDARKGDQLDRTSHIPGDWQAPASLWPPGAVIRDQSLFRLDWEPEGTVRFLVGLRGATVESADLPVEGDKVVLGEAAYTDDAPRLFQVYRAPEP